MRPTAPPAVDRRRFLGTGLALAIAPAAALVPVGPAVATLARARWNGGADIDDQWTGYPRYAEPIRAGRPRASARPAVAPEDEQFVPF